MEPLDGSWGVFSSGWASGSKFQDADGWDSIVHLVWDLYIEVEFLKCLFLLNGIHWGHGDFGILEF